MPKPINRYRHMAIYSVLLQKPGSTIGEIASQLNLTYSQVNDVLPSMEKTGILLYEDDERRLYPLTKKTFKDT